MANRIQIIKFQQRGVFGMIGDMFSRSKRDEFQKQQGKFGKERADSYRAEYEKDIKERTAQKLNWNIKNRWEQRLLDDVMKN